MKTAMVIGGIGFAIAVIAPVMRGRKSARVSEREYFAAARRRAIAYRLTARGVANGDQKP